MSTVSISRVVDVEVNVNNRFPTIPSFGIPMILVVPPAPDPDGIIPPSPLTTDIVKAFSTLAEVEAYGFDSSTDAYKTAAALIGVNNAPPIFKFGLMGADIASTVTALQLHDPAFYAVVLSFLVDETNAADLITANQELISYRKLLFFGTDDDALKADATDATGLASLLRTTKPSRLIGFYTESNALDANGLPYPPGEGPDVQQYAAKLAAYVSGVNYNNAGSHYTAKFKRLDGATPTNLTDTEVQNLTGFLPDTGLDPNVGGFLNAYICMAGLNMVVEGIATDDTFIDEITFSDWLYATMQANVLAVMASPRVVTYDAAGISIIMSAITQTLDTAIASGALTESRSDVNGTLLEPYEISVQEIAEVVPAIQAQRIAPNFQYCARYSGAIHKVDIVGTLKLAN